MANLHNKEMSVHAQPDAGFIRASLCLSQNENGRLLQITMRGITIPVGSVATLTGTKPDGNVYSTAGTISGNVISIQEDMQMTAVAGTWDARLNIINDGNVIGTAKIRMVIVPDTVNGDAVPSDSRLDGIIAECKAYAEAARGAAYGSPLTANTAADMDDPSRVYVYTGSEDGKVAGNWYYWNGTAWDSGGAYNSTAVNTDTTLALPGSPADSATVGEVLHYANPTIIDGKTIKTNGSTVDVTDVDTESGWSYAVDDCSPGEVYTISGHGGANTRLWCFIDADGNVLSVANVGQTEDDLRLVAPPNADKIVCNFQPSAHTVKLTKIMSAFYTDYFKLTDRNAPADALRVGEETRDVRDHLNALHELAVAGRVDALIGAKWSLNHISADTGLDKDNGYNCRSDNFIPVSDCDGKLYYSMNSPDGIRLFAYFYNASKQWISHDAGSLHTGSYEGSITLPANTAYVRFLLSNEDWGKFDKISDATDYFRAWFVPADAAYHTIYGSAIETAVQSYEADAESARLGYIWISDMHLKSSWAGNTEAVKRQLRAVAEIANRTPIDFVCLGGDIIDAETDADDLLENINDWLSPLAECTKPVIYLIGNHDDNSYGEWLGKLPAKNLIVDRGEFHNSICAPTSNAGYFYVDLDRKGVRVVCLDTIDYESRSGKKGSNWWSLSQSQVKWFANVACNTSYDIVILSHMCPDYDYNSWHLGNEGSYHSDLMTMISTYNSRGTVTKYSKTFDFTNATGKIKMMHVGHSHFEFDDALTVGGIPCIFTSCAKQYDQAQQSYETAVSGKTDTYEIPDGTAYSTCHQNTVGYEYKRYTTRTLGTISEALFDLVSVQNTAANLYRIGAGSDRTFTLAATNPRAVKPTDKTLSLPDKPADAQAVGNEISSLKEDLNAYSIVNYNKHLIKTTRTDAGVTYTYDSTNDKYTFVGTSDTTSVCNLILQNPLTDIKAGVPIHIKFNSTDTNVWLQIFRYVGSTLSFFKQEVTDEWITLPSDTTGVLVRARASNNKTVDGYFTIDIKGFFTPVEIKGLDESLKAIETELPNKLGYVKVLTSEDDMDDFGDTGAYCYLSNNKPSNAPSDANNGVVTVLHGYNDTGFASQLVTTNGNRLYFRNRFTSGYWTPWIEVTNKIGYVKALGHNDDLDTVVNVGVYAYSNSDKPSNVPTEESSAVLTVLHGYDSQGFLVQQCCTYSGKLFLRMQTTTGSWTAWSNVGGGGETGDTIIENTYNITTSPTITTDSNGWLQAVDTDTADETGKTDMTGAIMSMLTDTGYCHLGEGIFYVSGNIDMPEGSMLCGCGKKTVVRLLQSTTTGYCVKIGKFCTIKDISFEGARSFSMPSSKGTRNGIAFMAEYDASPSVTTSHCMISNVWCKYFSGAGIYCHNTSINYAKGVYVSNAFIDTCYVGIDIDYYSEFNKFVNVCTAWCKIGCVNNGGNNVFSNCTFHATDTGFFIDGTQPNNAHGTITGCTFCHIGSNAGKAIHIKDSANGFVINACQIWYNSINIENSSGIVVSNCELGRGTTGAGATIVINGGDTVMFVGCVFMDDVNRTPDITITNNTKVKFVNCYGSVSGNSFPTE